MAASSSLTPLHIASRVSASLIGSYAFVWGFVTLGIALLIRAGMPYGDAQTLMFLLAFLAFLGCFLWAFAAARLARVWWVLGGGGCLMTGAAWLLTRSALT